MAILVNRTFRHENGALAAGVTIQVVLRGTNTVVATDVTDSLGLFSAYLEPGSYDFLYQGYRVPFDLAAPGQSGEDYATVALVTERISAHETDTTPHQAAASGRDFAGWYNAATN